MLCGIIEVYHIFVKGESMSAYNEYLVQVSDSAKEQPYSEYVPVGEESFALYVPTHTKDYTLHFRDLFEELDQHPEIGSLSKVYLFDDSYKAHNTFIASKKSVCITLSHIHDRVPHKKSSEISFNGSEFVTHRAGNYYPCSSSSLYEDDRE